MATIGRIPKAVHSSLRSGTLLFDLTRVVEELLYNSLDAGAKKVSVYVGIKTCYVKVVDNGFGITRDGLMLLGEKYATSKMNVLADTEAVSTSFGFRGEALGSVSDISVLEIVTKTHGMPNGYRKIIKGCKCLYFGVDDSRHDIGTTVTVRDLYYNQPVRRKQMQNGTRKVLHSVKKCVLRIALMHPKVSFTVIDVESEGQLFSTQQSFSSLSLLIKNFGTETCEDLLELDTTDGMLRLSGYISSPRDAFSPKALQLIYINLRYVGKCLIHKLLNELASRFAFPGDSTLSKRSKAQMHPSFILNLTCPRSFYDLSFEPSHTLVEFKNWSCLLAFIERSILKFWKENQCGEISSNVAAFKGDPLKPIKEDSRTGFPISDDVCWIQKDATSVEYFSERKGQRKYSESPCIPSFQFHMVVDDFDNKKSVRGFDSDRPALDCDINTNWRLKRGDEYQCPDSEDEISYLEGKSQLYKSELTARERNSVRDNPFLIHEDLFEVRPNRSRDKVVDDDYFNIGDNISNISFKPFLKSCSTRVSSSFGVLPCENDHEDDMFLTQRNHVNMLDRVDATKYESKTELSGSLREINLTDPYLCSPDKVYSRHGSQGQCLDLTDILHGITDDCFRTGNFVSGAQWEVDSVSDLPTPPHKKICSRYRECLSQSSEDGGYAVRRQYLSPGEKANFGSDVFSFDSEIPSSIYPDTFGDSREWLGCPSSELRNDAYRDDFLFEEMEDVLVEHGVSLCYMEDDCRDRSPKFDSCKYVNISAPIYMDTKYQDDYLFTENKDLFANDVNSCYNSLHMDSVKANSWSKSLCNDIPSSSGCCEHIQCKLECLADRCSQRKRVRSHSAPPFFRSKNKFNALCDYTSKEKYSVYKSAIRASVTQEAKVSEDLPRSLGASCPTVKPNTVENLNARSQMMTRPERGLDVHKLPRKKLENSPDHYLSNLLEDQSSKEIQLFTASGMKWRSCSPVSEIDQFRNSHHDKYPHDQQSILDISSGILQYSADLLVPECIDKDCLMDAKVLQQVDKKFIPIVGRGILAVIDQHAADERIKLEELRHKVLSGEVRKTTYLDQEQVMELPEVSYQLLHKYATKIENWGWICNVHAQASNSFRRNMNLLRTSSSSAKAILTAVPCVLGISLSDTDLLEYLQQLADTDGSSTIPPAIFRILNSKACRGAIMFGDTLLPSECSLLVEELKNTSLCFQCAHGRPTAVPLVNLRALHKQIANLPTSNGESRWHGLSRRQVSVNRVQRQLHPARC